MTTPTAFAPGMAEDYVTGREDDTGLLCKCDHVKSANDLHCLQSQEPDGAAQVEGFAHFYASKIMNNPGPGCTFVYYKEFQSPLPVNPLPPGSKFECTGSNQWLNRFGARQKDGNGVEWPWLDDNGVEWDWLGFLYAIHRHTTPALTMNDLVAVYGQPSSSRPERHFQDLVNAAQQNLSHEKFVVFRDQGDAFGVNH